MITRKRLAIREVLNQKPGFLEKPVFSVSQQRKILVAVAFFDDDGQTGSRRNVVACGKRKVLSVRALRGAHDSLA
jgi:hypothetical protein